MKNVPVKNTAEVRIIIRTIRDEDGLPLSFGPGEEKGVPEAVLTHPAMKRYLGGTNPLQLVEAGAAKKKAAPAPTPPPPPPPEDPPEEEDEEEEEDDEEEEEDLRALYLSAPGITENNVDAVLEAYPTLEELVDAEEDGLVDCGVSKSFVNRVLEWAAS